VGGEVTPVSAARQGAELATNTFILLWSFCCGCAGLGGSLALREIRSKVRCGWPQTGAARWYHWCNTARRTPWTPPVGRTTHRGAPALSPTFLLALPVRRGQGGREQASLHVQWPALACASSTHPSTNPPTRCA